MSDRIVCRGCRGAVRKRYDHVGDCETPGACSGTFEHIQQSRHNGRPCPLAKITHRDVLTIKS